jgi:hypothetical protein
LRTTREFEISQVRWGFEDKRFYCFSNFTHFGSRSRHWMKRQLKAAGWTKIEYEEVFEAEPPNDTQ